MLFFPYLGVVSIYFVTSLFFHPPPPLAAALLLLHRSFVFSLPLHILPLSLADPQWYQREEGDGDLSTRLVPASHEKRYSIIADRIENQGPMLRFSLDGRESLRGFIDWVGFCQAS